MTSAAGESRISSIIRLVGREFNLAERENNLQSIKVHLATGNPIKNILFQSYISFCHRKRWVEIMETVSNYQVKTALLTIVKSNSECFGMQP